MKEPPAPTHPRTRAPLLRADEIIRRTRANPLVRAIKMCKRIKDPKTAVQYWLQIAAFVYAKAEGSSKNSDSPIQSKENAQAAYKLLTQLEDAAIKEKKEAYKLENAKTREEIEAQYGPPTDPLPPEDGPSSGRDEGGRYISRLDDRASEV